MATLSATNLLGYPYPSDLPYAPLEDPERSANMIVDLSFNSFELKELSRQVVELADKFIDTQKGT